MSTTE